ncbi:pseudouridine synthase [Rickettsiales bacterium LUAb2]
MKIRIAKRIAETRIYSRRKAEELIFKGLVKVNNIKIITPNFLVEDTDIISVNNQNLSFQQEDIRIWLYHKPKGIITSKGDPKGRQTIYDLLPQELQNVLYVGRLDYNSEGLLLLTNNGHIANQLTLAKNNITRIYKVKTYGKINNQTLAKLENGVTIDGITYNKVIANIISQSNLQSWISFKLTEGKNNEIRNICNYLELQVSKLVRTSFGLFELKNLGINEVIEVSNTVIKNKLSSMGITY